MIRLSQRSRPELERFRITLARAMEAKGLSASQLAKAVWGTMQDGRGIEVARNRDRMTHYLAGVSYPTPNTLAKLAAALEIDPAQLARDEEARTQALATGDNPGPNPAGGASGRQTLGVSMTLLASGSDEPLAMVSLSKPLPLDQALMVVRLVTGRLTRANIEDMERRFMAEEE